ncbi:MAG TPA: glycosyl hydrolase, partial [Thermoleophilia bacterium]|nr:glycosyl hydrolase [Thermoleophilia bacterium]
AIVRMFYAWNSGFSPNNPSSLEGWAKANGKIPVISVKTKTTGGQAVSWSDIASAKKGSPLYTQMVTWADRMKAWPGEVYFCLNHEASNTKSLANGTAPEYIAAWQKMHKIFDKEGVTNVIWTWIIGGTIPWEVPTTDRRYGPKWYPGDDWVDVLAVDVYNWSTCDHSMPWRSFDSLTAAFQAFAAQHPTKATMVTEFGTAEEPGDPTAKADWITQAAEDVKSWNNLQAFMAFHSQYRNTPGCQWWLDTSKKSLKAAQAVGAQPYYGG